MKRGSSDDGLGVTPRTGDANLDTLLVAVGKVLDPAPIQTAAEVADQAIEAVAAAARCEAAERASRSGRAVSMSWSKMASLVAFSALGGFGAALSPALAIASFFVVALTLLTLGTVPGRAPAHRVRSKYRRARITNLVTRAHSSSTAAGRYSENVKERLKRNFVDLVPAVRADYVQALEGGYREAALLLPDLENYLSIAVDASDDLSGQLDTIAILTESFADRSARSPSEGSSRQNREALSDSLTVVQETSYDLFSVVGGALDLAKRLSFMDRPANLTDWVQVTSAIRDLWLSLSIELRREHKQALSVSNSLHRLVTAEWLNELEAESKPGPVLRSVVGLALLRTPLNDRPACRAKFFENLVTARAGRTSYVWKLLLRRGGG